MLRSRLRSALVLGLVATLAPRLLASDTPTPAQVVIPGSLQSELGCPGDWQPECDATAARLRRRGRGMAARPSTCPPATGNTRPPLNHSWDENYGANAVRKAANIHLDLAAAGER